MAEKSDGESGDNILEQIRILEKQKSDLECKRKENEQKNKNRQLLEKKLRELQGEVTSLQDRSSRSAHEGRRDGDSSVLGESRDRLRGLQNHQLERSPTAGSSGSHKRKDTYQYHGYTDESSDDEG